MSSLLCLSQTPRSAPFSHARADSAGSSETNRVKQRYTSKVMRGFAGTMSEDLKKEFEVRTAFCFFSEHQLGGLGCPRFADFDMFLATPWSQIRR